MIDEPTKRNKGWLIVLTLVAVCILIALIFIIFSGRANETASTAADSAQLKSESDALKNQVDLCDSDVRLRKQQTEYSYANVQAALNSGNGTPAQRDELVQAANKLQADFQAIVDDCQSKHAQYDAKLREITN